MILYNHVVVYNFFHLCDLLYLTTIHSLPSLPISTVPTSLSVAEDAGLFLFGEIFLDLFFKLGAEIVLLGEDLLLEEISLNFVTFLGDDLLFIDDLLLTDDLLLFIWVLLLLTIFIKKIYLVSSSRSLSYAKYNLAISALSLLKINFVILSSL